MRECLMILFRCYDGKTYIKYCVAGKQRFGLLALCCIIVDGADYGWLTDTRGPKALYGCGKCRIMTSQISCNVTSLWRWNGLRRTFSGEQVTPLAIPSRIPSPRPTSLHVPSCPLLSLLSAPFPLLSNSPPLPTLSSRAGKPSQSSGDGEDRQSTLHSDVRNKC